MDDPFNEPTFANPQELYARGMKVFSGRFVLERRIGRGGMGEVWLARDMELGDERALKFLPPEIASDPGAIGRLRREALAGRKLTHPRIVKTDDFYVEGDYAAVAMSYIKGKTLGRLQAEKEKGFFEPHEIEAWLKDVCEALDYAHQEVEMVHRDLKPQNIIVEESSGNALVMDFGIARRIAETHTQLTGRDESGTLAYMSPQQLGGDPAVPADDIYSLGATIYELLTGTPPFFRGDLRMQIPTKVPSMMKEHREQLFKEHMIGEGWDELPENLENMVAGCLLKERAGRPESGAQLLKQWRQPATSVSEPSEKDQEPKRKRLKVRPDSEVRAKLDTIAAKKKSGKGKWLLGAAALAMFSGVMFFVFGGNADGPSKLLKKPESPQQQKGLAATSLEKDRRALEKTAEQAKDNIMMALDQRELTKASGYLDEFSLKHATTDIYNQHGEKLQERFAVLNLLMGAKPHEMRSFEVAPGMEVDFFWMAKTSSSPGFWIASDRVSISQWENMMGQLQTKSPKMAGGISHSEVVDFLARVNSQSFKISGESWKFRLPSSDECRKLASTDIKSDLKDSHWEFVNFSPSIKDKVEIYNYESDIESKMAKLLPIQFKSSDIGFRMVLVDAK